MVKSKKNLNLGCLFIISAPTGAGKTTLVNEAIKRLKKEFPISKVTTYTTRKPRPKEINGEDYYFLSEKEFKQKINENFFLETTKYNGEYYGSPNSAIEELKLGKSFIIITDMPGVKNISKLVENPTLIWIEPPIIEELKKRILKRESSVETQVNSRLKLAEEEMKEAHKPRFFEYIIVNKIFNQAISELVLIIKKTIEK